MIRLHPWQESHDDEWELARALAARGVELAFALPQNRELVRDPARWEAAIAELARRFRPLGKRFQIGQAINRSKWGIWNYDEYLALAARAAGILRAGPAGAGVELFGPAVIDFEAHVTAAVVNLRPPAGLPELRFDGLASLLYVDRRGAPENRQLGFDTEGKVRLLAAIAGTARLLDLRPAVDPGGQLAAARGAALARRQERRRRRGGAGRLPGALLPARRRLLDESSASTGGSWSPRATACAIRSPT